MRCSSPSLCATADAAVLCTTVAVVVVVVDIVHHAARSKKGVNNTYNGYCITFGKYVL